jgi:uncharacterized caspase-like protein
MLTGGLRRQHLLVGLFLIAMSVVVPARAEKRVALVIGNGAYKAQNQLVNPPNDAHLISRALAQAHFETIETKTNLGIAEFRQALRRFQSQANGADVAFVYFAGHGIEANGANWLIPTDAQLDDDRDLEYEAIKSDLVLQALQGARMRMLVLDACRNNPFGRNWRASVRSTTIGLAKIEADDVLVLFAAAPGRTAADGTDLNSPFAEALAKRLPEPGLAIQLLGGTVRDDVLAATGGNQRPYVSASITGKPFFLVPAEQPAAEVKQAPTPAPAIVPTPAGSSEAAEAWAAAKDTTNVAPLEAFISRYKDTFYAEMAQARIKDLKLDQAAKVSTRTEQDTAILPQRIEDPDGTSATLARALQAELKRVGCDPGELDGVWGEKAKNAMAEFARLTKKTLPNDAPSSEALRAVQSQNGSICNLTCGAHEKQHDGRCVAITKSDRRRTATRGSRRGTEPKSNNTCWSGWCRRGRTPGDQLPLGAAAR